MTAVAAGLGVTAGVTTGNVTMGSGRVTAGTVIPGSVVVGVDPGNGGKLGAVSAFFAAR